MRNIVDDERNQEHQSRPQGDRHYNLEVSKTMDTIAADICIMAMEADTAAAEAGQG